MKIKEFKRRDFLKIMGLAVSSSALGGLDSVWAAPDALIDEALRGPGIESFKNTICQLCTAGCGIRVRMVDGIPVHLDGNPIYPVNRGGICPHGSAGLDFLYNPDRLAGPMKRTGKRGEGRWQQITWDEAIKIVTERLADIRKSKTPEQLAFFTDRKSGLMYELISSFMKGFGSNNLIALNPDNFSAGPFQMLLGWEQVPEYDIADSKYVLSIGANFLEEGPSPVRSAFSYGKMRENQSGGRAKVVYVDPRHSLTAGSADRFIPIKLGTHGVFALGLAYVLIKEKHYDKSFVDSHVKGFESWKDAAGKRRTGFKGFVLENYYPEKVAQITGAPARAIVEVAREFGKTRPAVAMIGEAGTDTTNGMFNSFAVLALNVLIGNIEKPGGLRFKRSVPFERFSGASPDSIAKSGLALQPLYTDKTYRFPFAENEILNFCDNLEKGEPHPINTLFIYGSNPAFDHPYARKIRRALDKIPFIVSFAGHIDDTSEYADIVLPEHSPLERWMDSGPTAGVYFAHAAVSQPVVKPLYDTRHTGDVLKALADNLGGSVSRSLPSDDFLAALKKRFHGVYTSGEGSVVSGSFEESWVKYLKERGWQNYVYESFDDFWNVLVERGGWWNPSEAEMQLEKTLKTPSRKIELYCSSFDARVNELAAALGRDKSKEETRRMLLGKWKISEKGDSVCLPHFEEPRFSGSIDDYPYLLLTFGVLSNRTGAGSFSPILQEMFGYYRRVYWESWIELNPELAHEHGIREGDWAEVASPEGSVKARVVINEALEPHIVAVPFGMGHTSGGRYAKGIGVNPYNILSEDCDYLWGKPTKACTRVKIAKTRREKV